MWKQNSADVRPTTNIRFPRWLFILAFVASACTADATPVVEPTQTLIPPTSTFTPSPQTPTQVQSTLPAPDDLAVTQPAAETLVTSDSLLEVDPVAAELVALAQRRIAQDLGLPTRRVRLVEVKAYVWTDTSLGCPVPGESYTQQMVDGYRILLVAGEQEYIFHTDIDRALPCDAANEQLPDVDE